MEKIDLWGYKIYSNGDIISPLGKTLKKSSKINVKWGKEKRQRMVSYSRFVYYAFNQDKFDYDTSDCIIIHKNGNISDFSVDNLKEEDKNYIFYSRIKLSDEQIAEIKNIYSTNIDDTIHKNHPHKNISYRKLAKKFNVSHTFIERIVKGEK